MYGNQLYIEEKKTIPEKIKLSLGDPLQLTSGRYTIIAEIGRGGFAHVYSITDKLGETYAIKILDMWTVRPDEYDILLGKFKQEFNAGRVRSEAIAKSYFTGHIGGNPYIIMDYCPNGSLAKRIKDFYELEKFERIALTILTGLKDLHREGIIHRDLKPENVLFDKLDNPRLTDFGIAGHLNSRLTSRNFIGMVHQVWGTPLYSPPEQLSHQKAYKHTAPSMDIFSFGILMYEVISGGHHPFGDHKVLLEDTNRYLDKVNEKKIIALNHYRQDVPQKWTNIIYRCLQPKPQDRYESVDEIIQILEKSGSSRTLKYEEDIRTDIEHAILKVVEGENVGHVYYLSHILENLKKNTLLLGWSDSSDLAVNDIGLVEKSTRYISRSHATLIKEENKWCLCDGKAEIENGSITPSKNGTYTNYKQLVPGEKYALQNNDIISIGNVRLKFILL